MCKCFLEEFVNKIWKINLYIYFIIRNLFFYFVYYIYLLYIVLEM